MYLKQRGKKKPSAASSAEGLDPSAAPPAHKASILLDVDDFDHRLGDYQLMEGIGKGGYGLVYRGLNITTGITVAVKRIGLTGIPTAELEGILQEIKLLEALEHPNIVKYLDSVQTPDHLNIILEFVENGALSSLLTRFGGAFPESLVCHYISQVLMGLHYLHQQGVIHRDIKGANILSTKEGNIKLADFGVATRLSDSRKSDSVVGTPYWMAPEIIEMTGQQSSACDIWSVGCTVLELLTGKPPYFDLQQMPALFRIVQDEHPPLPDGISASLKDFLLSCFAKDPNRRIDAAGLLKHPWLKKAVEKERAKDGRGRGISEDQKPSGKEGKGGEEVKKAEEEIKVPPPLPTRPPAPLDDDDEDWDDDGDGDEMKHQPIKPRTALGDDADDLFAEFSDDDSHPLPLPSHAPLSGGSVALPTSAIVDPSLTSMMIAANTNTAKRLEEFVEREEEEEFGDMIDDEDAGELHLTTTKHHMTQTQVEGRKGGTEEEQEEDPFDDLEFTDPTVSEEDVALNKTFTRIISLLTPDQGEEVVIEQCERLMSLYRSHPHRVLALMNSHAVIPIMEMLTVHNTNVIYALLKLINLIITSNQSFLQSLCLVGLIPAIIRFAAPAHTHPSTPPRVPASPPGPPSTSTPLPLLRVEAANFIRQFCYTSEYTRKMFIACDGLSILISFLSEPYHSHLTKNLIFNAIDCVRHVFDSTFQPKNDFCRLFCKFKLLPPLIHILVEVAMDSQLPSQHEFLLKISQILHLFSQGDTVVKQQFAQPSLIARMLSLLPILPSDCLLLFLKSFCALSMDSNTLDNLEEAGAIPALLPHLAPTSPPENQHQVLLSMYYLCQLKASRQEQAALHGLIPHLQRFIASDHPLKQFAFPIIFALCKTSKKTRMELKKCNAVLFYLHTLRDPYWRSHALEVLAVWLSEDPQRVGFLLVQPSSVNALLSCIEQTSNATQFEKMLGSVRKLLLANVRVNQCLGRSFAFVHVIVMRLEAESSNNAIRVNLLNILSLLLVAHEDALQLASDHDLLDLLEKLAADKEGVLVASLAQKMQDRLTAEAEREQDLAQTATRR